MEKSRERKTGLWLKGFPKLVPTDMLDISKVSEKELNKLYYLAPSPTRAFERSKTFHGCISHQSTMSLQFDTKYKVT